MRSSSVLHPRAIKVYELNLNWLMQHTCYLLLAVIIPSI